MRLFSQFISSCDRLQCQTVLVMNSIVIRSSILECRINPEGQNGVAPPRIFSYASAGWYKKYGQNPSQALLQKHL